MPPHPPPCPPLRPPRSLQGFAPPRRNVLPIRPQNSMHSFVRRATTASALLALLASPTIAQQTAAPAAGGGSGRGATAAAGASLGDSAIVNALGFRSIGPAVMSGRV